MSSDFNIWFTIGLTILGAVVAVIRLEGRVNAHDGLFIEREKLTELQHVDVTDRLTRIEAKLDQSLKVNGLTN